MSLERQETRIQRSIIRYLQDFYEHANLTSDQKDSCGAVTLELESLFQLDKKPEYQDSVNLFDVIDHGTPERITESRKYQAEKHRLNGDHLAKCMLYEDARQTYTKAIALNPNDEKYYNLRAVALIKMGKYEDAIPDCLEAIRLENNFAAAYGNLGLACINTKKYKDALVAFTRAMQSDPENAAYETNLSLIKEKMMSNGWSWLTVVKILGFLLLITFIITVVMELLTPAEPEYRPMIY